MLLPKKTKHRKWSKANLTGDAGRGTNIDFGSFGLKAVGNGLVTSRQIEAARRTIIRFLRKGGKMWVRVFPNRPITRKGQEVPMGGGKGAVDHYAAVIKNGRILFELEGISEENAREAFRKASSKLPFKVKFIK
jgi:large subunit ribosomal protein L16